MKELVQRHKKQQCQLKQSIVFENSRPLSDYAVHCYFQNGRASKHTQALRNGVRIPSLLSHQVEKQGRLPGRSCVAWCCTKTPSQHLVPLLREWETSLGLSKGEASSTTSPSSQAGQILQTLPNLPLTLWALEGVKHQDFEIQSELCYS